MDQAKAEGVSSTGPGGLLGGLTKRVLETALEGELDEHLGYAKHDPAGRATSNSRNGKRSKTVVTEVGPVELDVPRDRDGTFEPNPKGIAPTMAGSPGSRTPTATPCHRGRHLTRHPRPFGPPHA